MVAGRPRTHNREQIAKDIIEWARKPDSINLCKFCAYYDPPIHPSKLANWAKECEKFRQSYDIAKLFLGSRREEWLNQDLLHVKAYDLNATNYDYFLKEEKRSQQEYENTLAKAIHEVATDDQKKQHSELIQQLKDLQAARKTASKSSNID